MVRVAIKKRYFAMSELTDKIDYLLYLLSRIVFYVILYKGDDYENADSHTGSRGFIHQTA